MDKKKKYSVQDALEFITAEDSEYEGSQGSYQRTKILLEKEMFETPETTFKGPCAKPPDEIHTPLEYFKNFITDDMLLLLMEQTNLYSVQNSNHLRNVNTTVKELEILIGLYLRMGLCQMPGNRAYWENDTRCPMVADNMSRNRFQTLLGSLHFTDNTDLLHRDAEDKCWKICPWLEMFRNQCLDIQMVPFKGTHSPIRQYVKGKPHPWGLKIWARCSSSGMLHDFVVYQGGTGKKTLLGIGGDVVESCVKLCQLSKTTKFFDRSTFLKMKKSLAQRGRGSVDARVNKEESMVIVKWYDNKSVTLISSYCATEPQDTIRRWSKSGKAFVEVKRPHIVKEYNTFMGGIDLLDACIARYKYHMKSQRWYLYLFWQTTMLGVVNAWLIYRRDCKLLGRVRVGVPEDVQTDEVAHWPVKCEKRGRCKNCKVNATTTLCEKCDARLCFTEERNCFKSYYYQR
uniref:PiggyBac transposable element-derived protein domain-containing protein n=1 Tax=Maylandia zebra TaxID=106582 RepID=A0A3P9CH39_9CICH